MPTPPTTPPYLLGVDVVSVVGVFGVVFRCVHYMLHYISTTCFGMLHYMAGNDYRRGRRQVSFVVDEGLWVAVKGVAAVRGWSVTRLITEVLEREVGCGDVGVGPGGGACVAEGGVGAGQVGGRDRVDDPVEPAVERVDWDALIQRGRESRIQPVPNMVLDPIEEIA